jgi:PAS domain S-box-containing protein
LINIQSKLDYKDKTKEELINDLQLLQKAYATLQKQYDADTSLFRLTNERVRKSEELFRKAFLTSPDSVNINRLSDGMFMSINEGFTKILGYSEEEVIGKSSIELNIWADPESRNTLVNELRKHGKVENFPGIFLQKDGSSVQGLMSASIIDLEGEQHILSVTRDVTAYIQTKTDLESEKFLINALMNSIPDQIYFKDLESRFLRVNKALSLKFGLSDPTDIIGKTDFDFFSTEHAQQAYDDEQSIIKSGKLLTKTEKETHINGTDTWASTIKLPLRNDNGDIIGTTGISRDITENKRAEDAFLKLYQRNQAILAAVPEIIMEVDNDKIYTWANNAGLEFFGTDVVGKPASYYFEGEQQVYDLVKPLFDGTKDRFYIESWQRSRDGEKRLLAWWCQVLKNNEGKVTGALSSARDITEQKKAEQALAKEQSLMHLLMDNLPDHIYFKDKESRFLRINGAMARSLDLTDPEQAKGMTDFDFFSEEHAQQAFNDEQTIIRTGQSLNLEEKETHKDQPDTWVSTVKMPMTDNSGNIIGTFGISRDVTVRKRREMENNVLFEITRSMTTTSNLDDLLKSIHKSLGEVVYAKNCFIALMDYKSGMFSFPYFVDEFDQRPAPSSMTKSCTAYVFRTVKPFLFAQKQFDELKEQGLVEELGFPSPSWIGIPLQTPSKVIGVLVLQNYVMENAYSESDQKFLVSIGSQIAIAIERKQSETALFESERDLHESQKIAGLGSYNLNFITGTWTSSEILDSIFGIDENYSRSVDGWTDLIHPSWKDIMKEYLQKNIIEKHERFDKEYKIVRKSDNSERWVHGKGELIFNNEGILSSMFGSIMDITQRKLAEEEILIKNQLLQAINAEKDKFFSILAHDLRGPLSAFVSATQIITDEIQTIGIDEIKNITGSMKVSATNIYTLLENLLEWSRLRRGGMDFVPEKLNLKNKISSSVSVFSETSAKKGIGIDISIPDGILIVADAHMLDSVIRNLISNAIKFTPSGGKIKVSAERKDVNKIEVKVADSGIGMTPELKSKLFLIAEKTSRPGTEGESSTGLGLLLCKEFIEKLGGTIRVESEVGKGTSFYFSLQAIA